MVTDTIAPRSPARVSGCFTFSDRYCQGLRRAAGLPGCTKCEQVSAFSGFAPRVYTRSYRQRRPFAVTKTAPPPVSPREGGGERALQEGSRKPSPIQNEDRDGGKADPGLAEGVGASRGSTPEARVGRPGEGAGAGGDARALLPPPGTAASPPRKVPRAPWWL